MAVRLNENQEIVKTIKEGLKAKDGFCPCKLGKLPENKCMCQEFKAQIADPEFEGYCHCMLYYKSKGWRGVLDKLAPVGRMSVTNYMVQSALGVIVFYGFGLNMAMTATFAECAVAGVVICVAQIIFSNWWMKRYYYGPVEWLWRTATWMKRVPLKR